MEFLAAKGIAFQERDVLAEPRNMEELLARTGGVRGTPVIVVGDHFVRGFDRGKLSRLLGVS